LQSVKRLDILSKMRCLQVTLISRYMGGEKYRGVDRKG
jgi:hypothetical protein